MLHPNGQIFHKKIFNFLGAKTHPFKYYYIHCRLYSVGFHPRLYNVHFQCIICWVKKNIILVHGDNNRSHTADEVFRLSEITDGVENAIGLFEDFFGNVGAVIFH